ncbi:hypothetical protein BDC45DRAFT_606953 [Circinella umbellata]|nr:hypothetical protein BDC45DRAFT_606953 [Circinella umbellata]
MTIFKDWKKKSQNVQKDVKNNSGGCVITTSLAFGLSSIPPISIVSMSTANAPSSTGDAPPSTGNAPPSTSDAPF